MSRRLLTALLAAMVLTALPAPAGGEAKRCPYPMKECLERMSERMKSSGWVGIEYDDSCVVAGGYRVEKVVQGSPAEHAGLQPGDVLYALNGVRIVPQNSPALVAARKDWKPGQSVTYTIKREGADREIRLTLAPMPADVMARWIGDHMKQHAAADSAASK